MREGLAREFPEAVRGVGWVRGRIGRRGLVRSEPVVWATISAIGAGFVVGSVVQALVGLLSEASLALGAPPPFALFALSTIARAAAATATAIAAGGTVALAFYVLFEAIAAALAIPGRIAFCERVGDVVQAPGSDQCSALGLLTSLWPMLVGIGLGLVIARGLTAHGAGVNSLLRVAGALSLALFLVSQVWAAGIAAAGSVAVEAAGSLGSGLTLAAGVAAAAAAAGVIAAHIPRGRRSAALVALIWMLPWLTSQPFHASRSLTGPVAPENAAPLIIGVVSTPIAAAFLLLSAAVATRNRFIPRAMRGSGP